MNACTSNNSFTIHYAEGAALQRYIWNLTRPTHIWQYFTLLSTPAYEYSIQLCNYLHFRFEIRWEPTCLSKLIMCSIAIYIKSRTNKLVFLHGCMCLIFFRFQLVIKNKAFFKLWHIINRSRQWIRRQVPSNSWKWTMLRTFLKI